MDMVRTRQKPERSGGAAGPVGPEAWFSRERGGAGAHTPRTRSKAFGQLVLLGYDVAAFTPAAYRRGSLPRPLKDI